MKLSKSLLSAMLIGIAAQTLPSCTKSNASPTVKKAMEAITKSTQKTPPYNCPGCGLG